MKVVKQTPKGFRDFLPEDARVRESVITTLKEVFSSYGFAPLETPAIEYEETLLGKYGEEAEKLIYLFKDRGGRDVGLRYDLTVPLARVVAQYGDKLPLPFKRYQIAPVWRADKPQAGRFREFWQADIDIVGSKSLLADAEIIAMAVKSLQRLGLQKFKILINVGEALNTEYETQRIAEQSDEVPTFQIFTKGLDKFSEQGERGTIEYLSKSGFSTPISGATVSTVSRIKTPDEFGRYPEYFLKSYEENLKRTPNIQAVDLQPVTKLAQKTKSRMEKLFELLKDLEVNEKYYQFDPSLARGLEYYTGFIFEAKLMEEALKPRIGGGGRYDNLITTISGEKIPAVGFSFGIDRIIEALKQTGVLVGEEKTTSPDVLVTVFDEKLALQSIKLAKKLRDEGFTVEVYPDEQTSLEKQLKYADKRGIQWVVIIGPEELKSDRVLLRDMETGEQTTLTIAELIKKLS